MVGLEIIISGVVYVLSNIAVGSYLWILKKIDAKKFKEILKQNADLSEMNSKILDIISNPNSKRSARSQDIEEAELLDNRINEPISETASHHSIDIDDKYKLKISYKK